MMNYEEFKQNVRDNIRDFLPEKFTNADILLQEITKNNDQHFTGLMIRLPDSDITPNIYLEQYYEQYQDGSGMHDILQDIANLRASKEMEEHFDPKCITDFEQVKDKIRCRLINAEMNEEYLSDKPHMNIQDLAVIYAVDLGTHNGSQMSALITNSLLDQYGITLQELHDLALDNLSKSAIELRSREDIIAEMMFPDGFPEKDPREFMLPPEESIPPMYILSNAERLNGAAVVLDGKTMDDIAEKLGGDYFVIPSSIHEVIIIPYNADMNRREIEQMIQEVNAEKVAPQDRLSNHAYQYDSLAHELVRMDKMEERQAQRAEQSKVTNLHIKKDLKSERNRVSMKDKLAEKNAQIVKKEAGLGKTLPEQTKATALE